MNRSLKNKLLALSMTTAITLSIAAPVFAEENSNFSFGSQIVDETEKGNTEGVESLLAQGANPNEMGEFNTTPIMRAAYHGNNQLVTVLLNKGANPNMKDLGGACALSIAARENYPDVVKTLIKGGADPNLASNDGNTPLAIAKAKNNAEIVSLLADAGATNTHNNQQYADSVSAAAIAPAAGVANVDNVKPVNVATADINIDMSNGRLNNSFSSISVAKNQNVNEQYSLASLELTNQVATPKKPQISTYAYQLSDDQTIGNNSQNSILNLGTFKSEEFATNKINDLKTNFGDALNGVELKVVTKAMGPATAYQVNGGLLPSNKANDICTKLTAAGANCRVESSGFASQTEFSQYKGTVATPVAQSPQPSNIASNSDVTPSKPAEVSSQALPLIADATKSQTTAPTQLAQLQQRADTRSAEIAAMPLPNTPKNVGNFNNVTAPLAPPVPSAQSYASTGTTPFPMPLPAASLAANNNTSSSPSDFSSINNMLNPKNNDSTSSSVSPTASSTYNPPQIASNQPSISSTNNPLIVTPTASPAPPTLSSPNILVPPANGAQGQPTIVTHVVKPTQQTAAANPAPVAQPLPSIVASQPQPFAQAQPTPTPTYAPVPAPSPQIVIHADKSYPRTQVAAAPPAAIISPPPQAPVAASPRMAPPAPLRPLPSNKFEVSRPVKVTDDWQPNYADATNQPPQTDTFSNREIWVKIDYFSDESAARYYADSLKAQSPNLGAYRIRTTKPLTGGKASAQIGPFDSDEAANNVCGTVIAQNQGYHCQATGIFIGSQGYKSNPDGMRHSSLYGNDSPASEERHSSYNY